MMDNLNSSSHHQQKLRVSFSNSWQLLHDEDSATSRCSISSSRSCGGVRFHSESSLEEIFDISRLSAYDVNEIVAVWGDTNEKNERKQNLYKEIDEYQRHVGIGGSTSSNGKGNSRRHSHRHQNQSQRANRRRRMSDNLTFTTYGLLDKIEGTKRRSEKMQLREAGWSAVLWEQYEQQLEHQAVQHAHNERIPEAEEDEGESPQFSSLPIVLDDKLIERVYRRPSRMAHRAARREALRLQRDLEEEEKLCV